MATSEAEIRKQQAIERLIRLQAEKAIKTSLTTIVDGEIIRVPPPSPFSGPGNRLSDFPFESDQERAREREKAMEIAQERLKAGVAPFEDDKNIRRLPWEKTKEPESSPASGAKVPDGGPVPSRTPSFLSGASDVKAARAAYRGRVEETIGKRRREQPDAVRDLERLWTWVNEPMVEVKELEHRTRQLPRIQEMLDDIEAAHNALVQKLLDNIETIYAEVQGLLQDNYIALTSDSKWMSRNEAAKVKRQKALEVLADQTERSLAPILGEWKDIQQAAQNIVVAHDALMKRLLLDIGTISDEVKVLNQNSYKVLNADKKWPTRYDEASKKLVGTLKVKPANQSETNLGTDLIEWQAIRDTAQKIVASAIPTTKAVKIGYDPNDASDQAKIFADFKKTGGNALLNQVLTVCQTEGGKAGGFYTYKGQQYRMWHNSHGNQNANSNDSRTAWTIQVDGKYQVVGIGHHSRGGYKAIFPFSTDTTVQEHPASTAVTDVRT